MNRSVVYNNCYGGFSVSRAAVMLAREISNDPLWGGPCLKGDFYPGTGPKMEVARDYGYIDIARHDPILVQVVKQLGEKANGECSSLVIADIGEEKYRIEEYDGAESVITHYDDWL